MPHFPTRSEVVKSTAYLLQKANSVLYKIRWLKNGNFLLKHSFSLGSFFPSKILMK